jgi:hypothetical protein
MIRQRPAIVHDDDERLQNLSVLLVKIRLEIEIAISGECRADIRGNEHSESSRRARRE